MPPNSEERSSQYVTPECGTQRSTQICTSGGRHSWIAWLGKARPSGSDCGGLTRVTGHGLQSLAERSWETLHAWQGACMGSQGRRGLTAWSVKELN